MNNVKFRAIELHFPHNFTFGYYLQDKEIDYIADGVKLTRIKLETLGQMCLDSQGSEIYTGDMVEIESEHLGVEHIGKVGTVKFYEGCFWVDFEKDACPVWCEHYTLKVVGSIYLKVPTEDDYIIAYGITEIASIMTSHLIDNPKKYDKKLYLSEIQDIWCALDNTGSELFQEDFSSKIDAILWLTKQDKRNLCYKDNLPCKFDCQGLCRNSC